MDELYQGARLRRIPYAAVRAPEALLADQHLAERGFFVPIEYPASAARCRVRARRSGSRMPHGTSRRRRGWASTRRRCAASGSADQDRRRVAQRLWPAVYATARSLLPPGDLTYPPKGGFRRRSSPTAQGREATVRRDPSTARPSLATLTGAGRVRPNLPLTSRNRHCSENARGAAAHQPGRSRRSAHGSRVTSGSSREAPC
jgi:hypothetical protein